MKTARHLDPSAYAGRGRTYAQVAALKDDVVRRVLDGVTPKSLTDQMQISYAHVYRILKDRGCVRVFLTKEEAQLIREHRVNARLAQPTPL